MKGQGQRSQNVKHIQLKAIVWTALVCTLLSDHHLVLLHSDNLLVDHFKSYVYMSIRRLLLISHYLTRVRPVTHCGWSIVLHVDRVGRRKMFTAVCLSVCLYVCLFLCPEHNSTRRKAIANGTCCFCNQPKAHFGLPWVRPCDNCGKCYIIIIYNLYMDGKRIKCWSNAAYTHLSSTVYEL